VFSTQDKPRHQANVFGCEVLNEMVLYCPGTSDAVSLNESARAIWELCDGTRTVDDICAELADWTGSSPMQLRDDVWRAIDRLQELNLLNCGPTDC
jgi:hypothetical protein